jgi:hypothetical protein
MQYQLWRHQWRNQHGDERKKYVMKIISEMNQSMAIINGVIKKKRSISMYQWRLINGVMAKSARRWRK